MTILAQGVYADIHPGYYSHEVIEKQILSGSIEYRYIMIGQRSIRHPVHVITIDLKKNDYQLQPLKTPYGIRQLSKLHDIAYFNDSVTNSKVIAAINANFWQAYTNYPIGPFVQAGEIVELSSYKQWSSFIIDNNNVPYIDRINLNAMLINKRDTLIIDNFNHRKDSTQNIIYNSKNFNIIPYINADIESEFLSRWAVMNEKMLDDDSTETLPDSSVLYNEIIEEHKLANTEYPLKKYACEFIDEPIINIPIRCIVKSISIGETLVPKNGFLLSTGDINGNEPAYRIGDTLEYLVRSDIMSNTPIKHIITGTPRLVRRGKAEHEAYTEGSTGRRFIHRQLARTAIGYTKNKDTLILATVEYTSRKYRKKGADLNDMAAIMKSLGCYDAMNLDGGGSSIMLIDGKNVMSGNNPDAGRKISTGFGIILSE